MEIPWAATLEDKDREIKVLKARLFLAHLIISLESGETSIEDYLGDIERLILVWTQAKARELSE
jgi:hypothetical protein